VCCAAASNASWPPVGAGRAADAGLLTAAVGGFSAMCLSALVGSADGGLDEAGTRTARQEGLSDGTAPLLILAASGLPWLIPGAGAGLSTPSPEGVAGSPPRPKSRSSAAGQLANGRGGQSGKNAQAVQVRVWRNAICARGGRFRSGGRAGYLAFARRPAARAWESRLLAGLALAYASG